MKKSMIALIAAVFIVGIAGFAFYNAVNPGEEPDFKQGLMMPKRITIIDDIDKPLLPGSTLREGEQEVSDEIVIKTLYLEIEKAQMEKATKRDKESISPAERLCSITAVYDEKDPASGRLVTIEVLQDGTFIVSKTLNGREQYAKGQFSSYTMAYITGLSTLE